MNWISVNEKLPIETGREESDKVLICNNCKDMWIAPKERCDCGCTTLTKTHPSNYKYARNYT